MYRARLLRNCILMVVNSHCELQALLLLMHEYLTGKKEEETQYLIMDHITKCRNS